MAVKLTKTARWHLIAGNNKAALEYEKAIKLGATKTDILAALDALKQRILRRL